MNMPRFTAESALCPTTGHYRTGHQQAEGLRAGKNGAFQPAEIIEVHSCAPGYSDVGGTCWPDPLTEPGGGGGGEPGAPGDGEPHSGGGRGGGGPKKPPKTPRKKFRPRNNQPCFAELSVKSGEVTITDTFVSQGWYFKSATGYWICNPDAGGDGALCNYSAPYSDGTTRTWHCYNGHSAE